MEDYKKKAQRIIQQNIYMAVATASVNIACDSQFQDFADLIAEGAVGDFEVRGGKIIGGVEEIAIDDTGYANYSVSMQGFSVNANYYFVQTAGGGVSLSGDLNLFGGAEGATVSCSGDVTGSRVSG